jgi:hypothetical protein
MTSAVDQKTYWGLSETMRWICTRAEKRVVAMRDMDGDDNVAVAMFDLKRELDPRFLLIFQGTYPDADSEPAEPQGKWKASRSDRAVMMWPDEAMDDLLRKVHGRRVQMTAIKCEGSRDEQIPVPPAELHDLSFWIGVGYGGPLVGLWSRSRDRLVWKSPQFLRADVIRIWPARITKTIAVSGAILHHLHGITSPEAPLTKPEAKQRCIDEVPNAYPEAFKKAWAELESTFKRGRGKHGPRMH